MKRKERKRALYREGGWGGGGNERSWPINGLKCFLNGWIKKIGKLMVGTGKGGFAAGGRPGEKNSGLENFAGCENFTAWKISRKKTTPQSTTTPAKQKTKNCEETNL